MGLLKAGFDAAAGVLADEWREYFYCDSIDSITANTCTALLFKCSAYLQHQFAYKLTHSLAHDDEIIVAAIHIANVLSGEISSIQYESNILVSISLCFPKHVLQF